MKFNKLFILGFAFVLTMSAVVAEAGRPKEEAVARVYDRLIYPSQLLPQKSLVERYRTQFTEEKFNVWVKESKLRTLESIIYSALQSEFLEETEMTPTDEEIQIFIDFSVKAEAAQMGEFQAQRVDIQAQLQVPDLTEAKRKSLEDHLGSINQLIAFDIKRKEEEELIPNIEEVKKNSLQRISAMTVTAWKFNKALYEKYKGRVIFQQAGWEPIDAHKAFLEEHTQAGTFEIMDESFQGAFDRMDEYFKMGHNYMDQELGDQYFSKPWWDPTFEPM